MITAISEKATRYHLRPTFQIRRRRRRSCTPARPAITAVTTTAAIPGAQPVAKPRNAGGLETNPCEPSASRIRKGHASRNIRPYIEISGLRFTKARNPFSVLEAIEETVDIFNLLCLSDWP